MDFTVSKENHQRAEEAGRGRSAARPFSVGGWGPETPPAWMSFMLSQSSPRKGGLFLEPWTLHPLFVLCFCLEGYFVKLFLLLFFGFSASASWLASWLLGFLASWHFGLLLVYAALVAFWLWLFASSAFPVPLRRLFGFCTPFIGFWPWLPASPASVL